MSPHVFLSLLFLLITAFLTKSCYAASRRNSTTAITDHDVHEDMVEEDMEELLGGEGDEEEGGNATAIGTEEDQLPDVPSSLRAKATASNIQVSWSPPKNHRIIVRGYTIGWGIGVPDVYSKVLEPKSRSFTITDLRPQVEYVISLRAYNNMGDGQPAYDTVRTLALDAENIQIFPPVGLKANVLSSSTVILRWTDTALSPSQTASDNRYYVIRYTSNFRSSSPKYKFVNATKTSHMIDDLRPSTQYEFAVKVVRGRQESTWSMSVINSTLESAPTSAPRDLTIVQDADDASSLRLQWQPPKFPNGQITGYVILYTTDPSLNDRDWSVQALVGDKMNALLNNLLPETTYYFKIQAKNEKGSGPVSSHVSHRTSSDLSSSSTSSTATISLTQQSLYIIIAGISAVTLVLLLIVSLLLCRSRRLNAIDRKRKGYSTPGMSPRPKNKRTSRELNPPDLWIGTHHEQLELKSLDKNEEADLTPTPVLRTFQDPVSVSPAPASNSSVIGDDRKNIISSYGLHGGGGTGMGLDSFYDDVSRGASSSITASSPSSSTHNSQQHMVPSSSCFPSATSTIRRTGRAKPIMIPAESGGAFTTAGGCTSAVFEPSTGLSRPVYPRTYSNSSYGMKSHQMSCFEVNNCNHYDPVTGVAHIMQLPLPPSTNLTLSSSNVSYSSPTHSGSGGGSINSPTLHDQPPPPPSLNHHSVCFTSGVTSSPSTNNLATLRPLTIHAQNGRGFDSCSQNTPKHIVVKPQMNTSTSPLKKLNCNGSGFNTISGKATPHIVNPSFKDDLDRFSSHDELSRELDGIMKNLNDAIITSPRFDGNHQ